jgi:hypothetical protein
MNDHWTHALRRRVAHRILGQLTIEPPPPEISPITTEHLAELQRLFPLPKFFIFGYPRSGTTLLMRLVSLHPQVHCNREAHFFTRSEDATRVFTDHEICQWLERRSNRWTAGQGLETALVRLVADHIMEREARRLGKSVVGDKTPNGNGGQAVERLHAVYPDARLIYIVRDGRDAAISHRFQHFIDHPQYLSKADMRIRQDFALDSHPYLEKERSLFTHRAISEEALAWCKNVHDTHCLGQELFGDRYFSLRYEDLLADAITNMRNVWAFLQVEPEFPDLEAQVLEKLQYNPGAEVHQEKEEELTRHLRRGQQGAWQDFFTSRDRQVFKEYAGQALIDWGYEKGLEW